MTIVEQNDCCSANASGSEPPPLHPTGPEKRMTMAIPLPLLKVKLDGHGHLPSCPLEDGVEDVSHPLHPTETEKRITIMLLLALWEGDGIWSWGQLPFSSLGDGVEDESPPLHPTEQRRGLLC